MRLYYFTTGAYGLAALRNRRLKIARIDALNDPFEFLGWNIQHPPFRSRIRKWKATQNSVWGLLCLSRAWSHPLLWGHYAQKHHGMALGVEVPDDGLFREVTYCEARSPFPLERDLCADDFDVALLTKFSAWSYETEHRRVCRLSECIRDGEHYFEPFSEQMQLREVIVGDLARISRARLGAAMGDQASRVETFKARPAFGAFEVVRNHDDRLWR